MKFPHPSKSTTKEYFYRMILVTGGTGLVGSHLLLRLAQGGKKIRASYRKPESLKNVLKVFGYSSETPQPLWEQISWVQADITDIGALSHAFAGVEQVYHCAALISFDPGDYNTLVKSNVEGTANIVNLCLAYKVKKLCYVSSVAALGTAPSGKAITEATEWSGHHASVYARTKYQAELEVWRGAQEGLSVGIVNPGIVLGPGFWDRGSGVLFTYAAKGKAYAPPGGAGFVSVNDVVRAMTQLMACDVGQQRFVVVSENRLYKDVLQKMAWHLGVAPPVKTLPLGVLEGLWRMDWLWSTLSGKSRRLTKAWVKGMYTPKVYSAEALKNRLNFTFEALEGTIAFCCATFKKERRQQLRKEYRASLKPPMG